MTAQFPSKERLEKIASYELSEFNDNPGLREEWQLFARALLAAYEQEPVAYMIGGHYLMHAADPKVDNYTSAVPLYTHPAPSIPAVPDGYVLVPVEPTEAMLLVLGLTGSFEKMTHAYQAMLSAAPTVSDGWIPVSERLPDNADSVVTSNGFDIGRGWWDGDSWQVITSHDAVPGEITHWQPLPDAPKGV